MKKITKITDLGTIWQSVFGDSSNTLRTENGGSAYTPIGSVAAGVRVDTGTSVMFYNATAGVLFVSFGDQGMAAPSDATNGLPVLPGAIAIYNSGSKAWVRSNGAVNAYVTDTN